MAGRDRSQRAVPGSPGQGGLLTRRCGGALSWDTSRGSRAVCVPWPGLSAGEWAPDAGVLLRLPPVASPLGPFHWDCGVGHRWGHSRVRRPALHVRPAGQVELGVTASPEPPPARPRHPSVPLHSSPSRPPVASWGDQRPAGCHRARGMWICSATVLNCRFCKAGIVPSLCQRCAAQRFPSHSRCCELEGTAG